jgi:hypothetical protein
MFPRKRRQLAGDWENNYIGIGINFSMKNLWNAAELLSKAKLEGGKLIGIGNPQLTTNEMRWKAG